MCPKSWCQKYTSCFRNREELYKKKGSLKIQTNLKKRLKLFDSFFGVYKKNCEVKLKKN